MANISALGSAPVCFLDANGKQYSIPLIFISYASATAAPTVSSSWPGWTAPAAAAEQLEVGSWLGLLATQGFVTPAPVPPALPAFTISAQAMGAAGNDITINFTSQNTDGSLNVTVSTTQIYTALNFSGSQNSIEQVLGTNPTNGTQPGLAYVGTAPTTLPNATAGAVNFTEPSPGASYEFLLPGTNGILLPTSNPTSSDAGLITANITNAGAETFNLTLSWSKTVASVTAANLGSSFGYLIAVTAPAGGGFGAPAVPSTITLVGGANASNNPAVAASATVISS